MLCLQFTVLMFMYMRRNVYKVVFLVTKDLFCFLGSVALWVGSGVGQNFHRGMGWDNDKRQCKEQCQVHATSRRGQDSLRTSQSEWQRTEINGESMRSWCGQPSDRGWLKNRTWAGQWHSKALRGPGSTVTWGPSIPSACPQGLKLEARSAESGGGALRREGLLPGLGSGVSRQRQVAYSFLA